MLAAATAAHAAPARPLPPAQTNSPSVLLAFAPASSSSGFERGLADDDFSLAIMSAAQGTYSSDQLALDIGQGARIATAAYATSTPPALSIEHADLGWQMRGWARARSRADAAPQLLVPGLLAAAIRGGAGYAGPLAATSSGSDVGAHAAIAAGENGSLAAVALGAPATLLGRVGALLAAKRLVVCDLPAGQQGSLVLAALSRTRRPRELLIVIQAVAGGEGGQLLWAGIAGLGRGRELTSTSTEQRGLISSIDLAPTILRHLGVLRLPAAMRGAAISGDGALSVQGLRSLMGRLRVIGRRRLRALAVLLLAWVLLLVWASLKRADDGAARRAWALRAGGLALLWAPAAALLSAALEPPAPAEYAIITGAAFLLALLSDVVLAWPRALILPAAVTLAVFVVDALARTQLLMRSLLGPDPILGARFYGFGNELKSGLTVLVLAAAAAALQRRPGRNGSGAKRLRRTAGWIAATGTLLAVIEGWTRIGAAVGGVVLVAGATAIATILLLPGPISRRRALIAVISPAAALVLLAALDLATAHGSGHFTGSILHARSAGDLRDVLERRYSAAWRELRNHAMPEATALALLCAAAGMCRRRQLLAPVGDERVWVAALAGGLSGGVVGAFVEDSGPVLLVVAVFALGCVLSYLWGRPRAVARSGIIRSPSGRTAAAAIYPPGATRCTS